MRQRRGNDRREQKGWEKNKALSDGWRGALPRCPGWVCREQGKDWEAQRGSWCRMILKRKGRCPFSELRILGQLENANSWPYRYSRERSIKEQQHSTANTHVPVQHLALTAARTEHELYETSAGFKSRVNSTVASSSPLATEENIFFRSFHFFCENIYLFSFSCCS